MLNFRSLLKYSFALRLLKVNAASSNLFKILLLPFLGALVLSFLTPRLPHLDFSAYWKSAEMLLNGANPYDMPPDRTYLIDVPNYLRPGIEYFYARVWGPPLVLSVLVPFGFFSLATAKTIFTFLTYFSFLGCTVLLYSLYGLGKQLSRLRVLLLLLLVPWGLYFYALAWGAPGWIFIDGIVLALWLIRYDRKFWAGIALSLCCFKPHLFGFLAVAIILRSIREGDYKLAQGGALGTLFMALLPLIIQPHIYSMYLEFVGSKVPHQYTGASLGSFLHSAIDPPQGYLLYLPLILAVAYEILWGSKRCYPTLDYFIAMLTPVSVFVAPYAWGHDYLVALPILFIGIMLIEDRIRAKDWELSIRLILLALWCAATEKYFAFQPFFTHKFYLMTYAIGVVALISALEKARGRSSYASFSK